MPNFTDVIKTIDDVLRDGINTALDFVVPHARREPLNPMAYVRDVNEWFAPAAQMALDEMEGREKYPGWSYALASLPVLGKVTKPASKVSNAKFLGRMKKFEDDEPLKIITLNPIDKDHLAEVSKEMDEMGTPVIKAVYDPVYENYIALEGSHRINAAKNKGIKPIIDELDYEDVYNGKYTLEELDEDLLENNYGEDPIETIKRILDGSWQRPFIEIK